ncbi:T9SS type A sorting domain-containing protein [Flavobacterium ardleyense]|uniref:T9SS type A sorting domain-containing protein n=1 Tax=Flavobacterium ardleyense TaxID=2038737 RepID=A0ABW5Z848_9FLAO
MEKFSTEKSSFVTIDEQVKVFNEYWSTRNKDVRASGHKPFMRWEYHWRNYQNEQGFVMSSEEFWNAWREKTQVKASRNATMSLPVSNWEPVGPFSHTNTGSWSSGQGRVNIVHVDPSNPSTVYIGSPAGGIWKSANNGSTWTPLTDNLPQIGVSGIAIDYSNSNVIYIATGDKDSGDTYSVGVYKSIDGGVTWAATGLMSGSNPSRMGDVVIHPTNNQILWCATDKGIYKTINAGNSWSRVQTGNFSQGNIRLKADDPSTLFAVSKNAFFRSTNTGDSFTQITVGLPVNSGRLILDVTPANSNYIYILSATTGHYFQGIYRSVDAGVSFTATNTTTNVFENGNQASQSWFDLALAVSSSNENEIYTGCLNVWKSTNGGETITRINNWSSPTSASYTHADIHYLGFHGSKLFAGTDGGIYVSSNKGTNFTDLTSGAQISQFYKIAVSKQSSGNMVGGLQDNGGHAYSGGQWKNYYGADGMDTAIDPINPNKYYGFIQYGSNLYISNSGGNSSSSNVSSPGGLDGNWVTPLRANSVGTIFAGYNDLYRLSGATWVKQNTSPLGTGNLELISVDPSNDNIMYVANGTALYKSTDLGITFTNTFSTSSPITSIEVHSSNSNIIYLTTQGSAGQALKSIDGGLTFTNISAGLPAIGKNIIIHQGKNTVNPLYLGTTLGVYYRDDSMSSWQPFDANLPNVSVTDLEINLQDAKLIAATYGRGIWQTNIPIQIPAVDLKFVNIQNPDVSINCGSVIIPKVMVKNVGINTISSVWVNYTIDGTSYNYSWNGSITANESTLINLPAATLSRGSHTLSVNTTTTDDAYAENNTGSITFYSNDSGIVGLANPFTNPSDALISYNDSGTKGWVRGVRSTGAMTTSGNTVYTTNLTGNYSDLTKSYLVSQCYNLSTVTNPQISFAMKYDLEENFDVAYVQYSTDFGLTWKLLGTKTATWYNSNRTLATAGNDCQNCPGGQWTGTNTTLKTYSYPLNTLNSETNIIFRIVFHSDPAANKLGVNVDDFAINGTLSSKDFELNNVVVYPNPSRGIFNISLGNIQPSAIDVYDISGKIIFSEKDIQTSKFETPIDLTNASAGIYFVKITANGESVVKRIIKE